MPISALTAIFCYLTALVCIAFFSYKKNQTSSDFIIGGRGMSFWLTAFAAHASDMSSWIFMAYPLMIYQNGLSRIFVAIGLILFMFLNWKYVAGQLRLESEKYQAMTFSSYFESRFHDTSGSLRILSAVMCFIFYSIYISAGFYGLGLLLNQLFDIPFSIGLSLGLFIVVPYLFAGGYVTLAWTDFFQGLFLIGVILFVPWTATDDFGGFQKLLSDLKTRDFFDTLLPESSIQGLLSPLILALSWGLPYFGQPHIVTKFMGIKNPKETVKSQWLGLTWQTITLAASTWVGIIAIPLFINPDFDPQLIFIKMVKNLFTPFFGSLILCAILGTTITLANSQILVLASSLTEDFYRRIFKKEASSHELLKVSRWNILIVTLIAYGIALTHFSTISGLVEFAWFGLGSSFGPLILFAIYDRKANRYGAIAGILTGGLMALFIPFANHLSQWNLPTMIIAFLSSSAMIALVSRCTQPRNPG